MKNVFVLLMILFACMVCIFPACHPVHDYQQRIDAYMLQQKQTVPDTTTLSRKEILRKGKKLSRQFFGMAHNATHRMVYCMQRDDSVWLVSSKCHYGFADLIIFNCTGQQLDSAMTFYRCKSITDLKRRGWYDRK